MRMLGRVGRVVSRCVVVVAIVMATMISHRGYAYSLWRYGNGVYLDTYRSLVFDEPPKADIDMVVCDGDPAKADFILVSKECQTLSVIDTNGRTICCYPVAVGRNYGNKEAPGDLKTPEGELLIIQIQDAKLWGYDYDDGNGYIQNSYGNWFFRIYAPPHYGIGIHATIRPHNIGKRASEGCICLSPENLDKLYPLVREGMRVVVETSIRDMAADGRCYAIYRRFGNECCLFDIQQYACALECDILQDVVDHVVEPGDTHLSLAIKYSTTRKSLRALNPFIDFDNLTVGETVRVRGPFSVVIDGVLDWNAKPDNSGPKYYVATEVDTFGRIAVMHRSSAARIQELNPDLTPETLLPGTRVRVK